MSKKETIEPSDINKWDRNIIKSLAHSEFLAKDVRSSDALIDAVLGYIKAKGYKIVLDETTTPTWSDNSHSLHAKTLPVNEYWK